MKNQKLMRLEGFARISTSFFNLWIRSINIDIRNLRNDRPHPLSHEGDLSAYAGHAR